jgi:two-component system, cell cycle response regulator DivK
MTPTPLVLIVDDATDNREGYAQYLQWCGYGVAEAATGREALAQARQLEPDVILLDMRLPGMDGAAVSRELRAAGYRRTVIIALSASVGQADVEAALASGCDAFLAKPCLPETVVSEMQRILALRQAPS